MSIGNSIVVKQLTHDSNIIDLRLVVGSEMSLMRKTDVSLLQRKR